MAPANNVGSIEAPDGTIFTLVREQDDEIDRYDAVHELGDHPFTGQSPEFQSLSPLLHDLATAMEFDLALYFIFK